MLLNVCMSDLATFCGTADLATQSLELYMERKIRQTSAAGSRRERKKERKRERKSEHAKSHIVCVCMYVHIPLLDTFLPAFMYFQ